MNDPNMIPDMTHPLSPHWDQPSKDDILVDSTHALMSAQTWGLLHRYDASLPSGVYPGKMWRSENAHGRFLFWYGEYTDPDKCTINRRGALIV